MNRRTIILGGVFGAIIAYALIATVVYPRWIEPLLAIDRTIAQREGRLAELEAVENEVQEAKWAYRGFAERVGSFDRAEVEHDLRERLNNLIVEHGLEDTSVGVRRPDRDHKTHLDKLTLTVSAAGTLESTVLFLKDLAELPHLLTLSNPAISPASSSKRKGRRADRMDLDVRIDVWVLPPQRIVWRTVPEELVQPDSWVRHESRRYSTIWEREPFTEYVELDPLEVKVTHVSVEVGKRGRLEASATGGDGYYKWRWEPSEGLTTPDKARTIVDTSEPGTFPYTVTVTDESGNATTADATVTVREPSDRTVEEEVETPPPGPKRWKDGNRMQFCMVLIRGDADNRLDEIMVQNGKSRQTEYYTVGDEFDGGELVFVHQTGALVRRDDEYFVYPIGARLNEDIEVDEAADYPRLQLEAARRRQEATLPQAEPEAEGTEGSPSGVMAAGASGESAGAQTTDAGTEQGGSTGSPSKPGAGEEDQGKLGSAPARAGQGREDRRVAPGSESSFQKTGKRRATPRQPESHPTPPRKIEDAEKKD